MNINASAIYYGNCYHRYDGLMAQKVANSMNFIIKTMHIFPGYPSLYFLYKMDTGQHNFHGNCQ